MTAPSPAARGPLDTALQNAQRLLEQEPRSTVEQAREILKAVPGQPVALLLLGVGQRLSGELEAGVKVLQALSESQPRWPTVFYELGMAQLDAGEGDAALKALRRAVYLFPQFPEAWRAIGDHLFGQGDLGGADAAYAQQIKSSTQDPRLMAAATALASNHIPQAEQALRAHLKSYPTDVAAIRMLAEVAGRLGRYRDAETLLERALELSPSFHPARHNYALVLHRQHKNIEALRQIDLLMAADPRNPTNLNLKAVFLAKIGDYPQALALYADVLAQNPKHAKIWLSYGHALSSAGRQADSIAAYRRCVDLLPDFGEAYWSLANLKTFRFSDGELAGMRQHLKKPGLSEADRAHFHFALGKALEDADDYAAAFEHYAAGNAVRLEQVGHDPDVTTDLVKRSKALLTGSFFEQRRHFGASAPDPIFIVGLPRAGSTLIEQILSSHSQVEGTMELPNIISIAAQLGGRQNRTLESAYPESLAELTAERGRELGAQYIEDTRLQRRLGLPFFIDKMPNNFQHIGLIRLILPQAKIIDARRHPMACCFSGFKQNFAEGQRYTYSLNNIGRYYREYVELMAHYDAVLPGAVCRVIYERLVEDTEAEVRRLLDYCGLPFEESCLKFYENERAVRTASAHQVRQPIFRQGLDQWRHFEPWLAPLKDELGNVLDDYPHTPQYPNV